MKDFVIIRKVKRQPRRHVCHLPGAVYRLFHGISKGSIVECKTCNQYWRFIGIGDYADWEKVNRAEFE